jgi:hypothetical protein
MTKAEYAAWQAETAKSLHRWALDQVTFHNRGEYLFYKGGSCGTYVRVGADGVASIGSYEGAIPHIGEATFTPKYTRKLDGTADAALARVLRGLGLEALLALIGC